MGLDRSVDERRVIGGIVGWCRPDIGPENKKKSFGVGAPKVRRCAGESPAFTQQYGPYYKIMEALSHSIILFISPLSEWILLNISTIERNKMM
jgi:hypothetical protein